MTHPHWLYIGSAAEFANLEWPITSRGKNVCVAEYSSGISHLGVTRDPKLWLQNARRSGEYRGKGEVRRVAVSVPIQEEGWCEARQAIQAGVSDSAWPPESAAPIEDYIHAFAQALEAPEASA